MSDGAKEMWKRQEKIRSLRQWRQSVDDDVAVDDGTEETDDNGGNDGGMCGCRQSGDSIGNADGSDIDVGEIRLTTRIPP